MRAKLGNSSPLGTALRLQRRKQKLTQAAVGLRYGLGVAAVRAVERGQGRVATLLRLVEALGLELRGRALAAGSIGSALAAARKRRKQSLRELARALGVSRNTLAALERGGGLQRFMTMQPNCFDSRRESPLAESISRIPYQTYKPPK